MNFHTAWAIVKQIADSEECLDETYLEALVIMEYHFEACLDIDTSNMIEY